MEQEKQYTCPHCGRVLAEAEIKEQFYECPECGHLFPMPTAERIRMLTGGSGFKEFHAHLTSLDPLLFPDYRDKLEKAEKTAKTSEAVVTGFAYIREIRIALAVMNSAFLMGSMGTVVGEKIAALAEYAGRKMLPLVIVTMSGGARMQEGLFSLMQMAKTAAAIERYKRCGGVYITLLADPTTGGVTASFGMLGDVILAEPGALICFTGPRIVEQTMGISVSENAERAETLLERGMIDAICARKDQEAFLYRVLKLHQSAPGGGRLTKPERNSFPTDTQIFHEETPSGVYERVRLARSLGQRRISEFTDRLFEDFIEFKGDRLLAEDPAVIGGIASFHGIPVTVIGHRKGKTAEESIACNYGMPRPAGYRKAVRLLKQAERFHRPVITFIDSPGAYPGKEAEEGGQAAAIAECLATMVSLQTPVIAVVVGEGESGGALALSAADHVFMLENSVYGILSPEAFASVLWKDPGRAEEAGELMRMTAQELMEDRLIDRIIPEENLFEALDTALCESIRELLRLDPGLLPGHRYLKYRKMDGLYRLRHRGDK